MLAHRRVIALELLLEQEQLQEPLVQLQGLAQQLQEQLAQLQESLVQLQVLLQLQEEEFLQIFSPHKLQELKHKP